MNLRDLKYIVEVAREKNFARASEKVFVSQPALSMQIKKLEDTLGINIFERDKQNFLITPAGAEIIKKAEIILRESEEIKNIAKNFKDPFGGEIRIGAFPTVASYFLPNFVRNIHKKFPNLKIFLIEAKSAELIDKLNNGEIDFSLIAMPIDNENLVGEKIFSEKFLLATPKNHPFAKKSKIQIKELKNQELMLLEDGHCLRDQALEICSSVRAFEKNDFQATSLETLRQMVANGNGITLIPEIAVRNDDKVSYVKIFNAPFRTIGIYYRKSSVRKSLIKEIIRLAK
ncbi:MAG: LysR family transcriptional regulator [Alphaproteobacteria bacterium]|nr:LysR family transcriptional regulator [Alphaproteobacteria bacterium]